jgi:CheY-like chemotaxis protein
LRIEADLFEVDDLYASANPGTPVGQYARLRVSDMGMGMPQQIIDKIFDPFFTTKPLGKGTGLGLSTVLGIVKSHEGFLDVRSKVGKGSTFEVFLPVADVSPAPMILEEKAESVGGRGQVVLIVDDEVAVRKTTEIMLSHHGYRTMTAADGVEALAIYAERGGSIDAVFTDVMMPLVDGVALSRALRKMNPEVRIIAATGAAEESRKQELKALNVSRVLGKPFTTGALLAALEEAFSSPMTTDSFRPLVSPEYRAA